MNIFVPHSTSNRGLDATTQAPKELGDSQIFLEIRDASRIRKKINPLHPQKRDRYNQKKIPLQPHRDQSSPYNHTGINVSPTTVSEVGNG